MKVTLALAAIMLITPGVAAEELSCAEPPLQPRCETLGPPEPLPEPSVPTVPSVSPPGGVPPGPGLPGAPPAPPAPAPPAAPSPSGNCDRLPTQLPIGRGDPDQGPLPRSINLVLRDVGQTREFCSRMFG